jgi:DNA repair protein RadC
MTRLLRDSGRTVDIPVDDHIILGRRAADPVGRGYYSFREGGMA